MSNPHDVLGMHNFVAQRGTLRYLLQTLEETLKASGFPIDQLQDEMSVFDDEYERCACNPISAQQTSVP